MHHVVRDDQIERLIGELRIRAVALVKMHGGAQGLCAGVCITEHARADVDGVDFRVGEGEGIRHARGAGRASHVEDPSRLELRELFGDVSLYVRCLAVGAADALAEGVEIPAAFVQGAGRAVPRAQIHRVAAGLQMDVERGDAARRNEVRIQFKAAEPPGRVIETDGRRGQALALAKDTVGHGDPHLLLRRPGERGPASVGCVAVHRLADLIPRCRWMAVLPRILGRHDLLEQAALSRPKTAVQRLLEGDDELLS